MALPLHELLGLIDPSKLSEADREFIPHVKQLVAERIESQRAAEARPEAAILALQAIGVTGLELQPQLKEYQAFYGPSVVGMVSFVAPHQTKEGWRDQCFRRADHLPVATAAREVGKDLITFLTEEDYRVYGNPQGEYRLERTTSSPVDTPYPDRIGMAVFRGSELKYGSNYPVASVDCFADYRFDIRLMGQRMNSQKTFADAWDTLRSYTKRFASSDAEREKLIIASGRDSVRVNL